MIQYGSVCSGIEAASAAWEPLGWRASFLSEIELFPRAVLEHHYPNVPLHGDFTTIKENDYEPIDLLVGGTPCQSFSIAGLRGGVADSRGNLALEYFRLAKRRRPRWLVWENVPGVLSSGGGRDFGAILGALVELGYGFAYRVLDAQYFGVPQRRRRVFVVGYLGDWRPAATVLFERESLRGDSPPRRKAGERVARPVTSGSPGSSGYRNDADTADNLIASTGEISHCLNAGGMGRQDFETETLVTHSLSADGFDASEDGTGRGTPLVPVAYRTSPTDGAWATGDRTDALTTGTDPTSHILAFSSKDHGADAGEISPTLRAIGHSGSHANAGGQIAIAIQERAVCENPDAGPDGAGYRTDDQAYTLEARTVPQAVAMSTVRRLTPRECERLQGFPDDWTMVPYRKKPAADGPRYKAIGNSMAVPVMAWIGMRIDAVDRLISARHSKSL